ncbi:hypothetical protein A2Z33_01135 [Candidatus Gottesmanbacteria bacterium RBG_16_52_11]|uniref:Type 4 fimbrial biogenesis protein PilX N-terminal domain-containing protein n=1 Tax=Candidatus Gottesmanbacteria bacterium RBG_16_52_11 TaxID=1798374 RepID=A0A1F5YNR6_9BACT|nr:MAG: hypothetical protein A2Z33_01135 [Candidatus Gottesmanbacteria bacterium RBG_16_52_11]
MRNNDRQSGQVVLITLLVLSVATTIALAMAGRTTTDVKISTQVEESSRAFSAAEAGIEEGLRTGAGTGGSAVSIGDPNVTYEVAVNEMLPTSTFVYPSMTDEGDTATLWLTDPSGPTLPTSGDYNWHIIRLCFGNATAPLPAMVVAVYYYESGTYKVARMAFDPDGARAAGNNFTSIAATPGDCGTGNPNITHYRNLDLTLPASFNLPSATAALMLRFKPLYNSAQIAVVGQNGEMIPKQGNVIESCGTMANSVTRCLNTQQRFRTPSGLFDYVIFGSGGSFPQ